MEHHELHKKASTCSNNHTADLQDPAEAVVRFALLEVQLGGDLEVAADLLQSPGHGFKSAHSALLGQFG